jgi:hypothetical protein
MNYLFITLIAKYGPEAVELVGLYVRIQFKMAALFPITEVVRNTVDVML